MNITVNCGRERSFCFEKCEILEESSLRINDAGDMVVRDTGPIGLDIGVSL